MMWKLKGALLNLTDSDKRYNILAKIDRMVVRIILKEAKDIFDQLLMRLNDKFQFIRPIVDAESADDQDGTILQGEQQE